MAMKDFRVLGDSKKCTYVCMFVCVPLGGNAKTRSVSYTMHCAQEPLVLYWVITSDACQDLICRLQIKPLRCACSLCLCSAGPHCFVIRIFALAGPRSRSLPSCLLRAMHRRLLSLQLLYSLCCSASLQCARDVGFLCTLLQMPSACHHGRGHSHPPHTLGGKKVRILSECLPLLLTRPSSHGGSQCPCPLVSHFQVSLDLQELKRNVLFFCQYLLPGVRNHGILTRQSLCLCFMYSRRDGVFQVVDYFYIEHNNFIGCNLLCLPKSRGRIKV